MKLANGSRPLLCDDFSRYDLHTMKTCTDNKKKLMDLAFGTDRWILD